MWQSITIIFSTRGNTSLCTPCPASRRLERLDPDDEGGVVGKFVGGMVGGELITFSVALLINSVVVSDGAGN